MFVVPYRILNLPGITLAFLRFYETIFQFWNSEGKAPCFLSNGKIKERTGIMSSSTIKEAFEFFESHGEMERRTINGRRYIVQPERKIEIIEQKDAQDPLAVPRPPSRCTEAPPLATARHKKANIKKANIKKEKDKRYCASDDARSKTKQSYFDDFWDTYPRKKDKGRAKKIWESQKCDILAKEIIEDVKNRTINEAQWQDEQFIPHPSTYLRNKRWEDEITLRRTKPKKESHQEMVEGLFFRDSLMEGEILND
jgi:hypothetical protein